LIQVPPVAPSRSLPSALPLLIYSGGYLSNCSHFESMAIWNIAPDSYSQSAVQTVDILEASTLLIGISKLTLGVSRPESDQHLQAEPHAENVGYLRRGRQSDGAAVVRGLDSNELSMQTTFCRDIGAIWSGRLDQSVATRALRRLPREPLRPSALHGRCIFRWFAAAKERALG
jgi:hypothetical protein